MLSLLCLLKKHRFKFKHSVSSSIAAPGTLGGAIDSIKYRNGHKKVVLKCQQCKNIRTIWVY